MKFIVTGGAGFIGSHVVDILITQGHDVIVLDNLSTGLKENVNPKAEFFQGDILDGLAHFLAFCQFDAIIHMAAMTGIAQSIRNPAMDAKTNIEATIRICNNIFIGRGRPKIIFASTGAVYGPGAQSFPDERLPPLPQSFYALSKMTAERYILMYHQLYVLKYNILRFSNVYGPRRKKDSGYINVLRGCAESGNPLTVYGDGSQSRDFIHVMDVARTIVAAATTHQSVVGTFNVATGIETSLIDLVQIVRGKYPELQVEYKPSKGEDVQRSVLNPDRAKQSLSHKIEHDIKEEIIKDW